MSRYTFKVVINADQEMGWNAAKLMDEISEGLSHYGDLSVEVTVESAYDPGAGVGLVQKAEMICQNCGEPDEYDDHWDDLDGPNRMGYGCVRKKPRLADEVAAVRDQLSKRPQASKNFSGIGSGGSERSPFDSPRRTK